MGNGYTWVLYPYWFVSDGLGAQAVKIVPVCTDRHSLTFRRLGGLTCCDHGRRVALFPTAPHDLVKRIASFATGIPWPLYRFLLQHKADDTRVMDAFRESSPVVATLMEHGTIELLELAKRVRLPVEPTHSFRGTTLNLFDVTRFAITFHRPEALEWGVTYDRDHERTSGHQGVRTPPVRLWQLVLHECRDGDTRMLDVLKRCLPLDARGLEYIASTEFVTRHVNTVAELHWLTTELPALGLDQTMLTIAARKGSLEMVTYLHERGAGGRCDVDAWLLYNLHHRDVLAYLLDHNLIGVREDSARDILDNDDAFIQQLCRRHAPHFQRGFESLILRYVAKGNVEKVHLMLEDDYFDTDFPILIDVAAANGCLDVIVMLHERGLAMATSEAMDSAAENEHWDVVKFLHENRAEGCTTRAMDAAIEQEDFEHVKFLWENRSEGWTADAMIEAAQFEDTTILRFLEEHANPASRTLSLESEIPVSLSPQRAESRDHVRNQAIAYPKESKHVEAGDSREHHASWEKVGEATQVAVEERAKRLC